MTTRSNSVSKLFTTPYLARIAVLAALGAVLSLLEFPILPAAPFYKLDFSGVPVLLAGFSMGWPAGILTLLVKDLVGLLTHPSGGWVGQLADFIMLGAFTITSVGIYGLNKTRMTALAGMITGIAAMTAIAALANLYILFPFYGIPEAKRAGLILPATVPFNLIKGAALTVVTFLIYKPLSPILKGRIGTDRSSQK